MGPLSKIDEALKGLEYPNLMSSHERQARLRAAKQAAMELLANRINQERRRDDHA